MSNIKQCFVSRWGDDGYIVEVDYSQLEVMVQAFLSGDENMKKDLRDGVDFHCKRLSYQLGLSYEDVVNKYKAGDVYITTARSKVKEFSFMLAYGAVAKTISDSTGMSVSEVQRLMELEDVLYPEVSKFYKKVEQEVIATRKPLWKDGKPVKTPLGLHQGIGFYKAPNGREYTFTEYDPPEWAMEKYHKTKGRSGSITPSFSPTQMKNYPIQGFASDIVQVACGRVLLSLYREGHAESVKLINTVHDSLIFDIHKNSLDTLANLCHNVMTTTVKEVFKNSYDIDLDIPLRVDVEYGSNWKDLKPWSK